MAKVHSELSQEDLQQDTESGSQSQLQPVTQIDPENLPQIVLENSSQLELEHASQHEETVESSQIIMKDANGETDSLKSGLGAEASDSSDEEVVFDEEFFQTQMPMIVGYQNIGNPNDPYQLQPPQNEPENLQKEVQALSNVNDLSQETIRPILRQAFQRRGCLMGASSSADAIEINKVERTLAFHYKLKSFYERREICWVYRLYENQSVDGPENGAAPDPWEVDLQPTELFIDSIKTTIVPHTSKVTQCFHCKGSGQSKCIKCNGKEGKSCRSCQGTGKTAHKQGMLVAKITCSKCGGKGKLRCRQCHGAPKVDCQVCKQCKELVYSVQVKCIWQVASTDFIEERTDLPDELIRDVTGSLLMEEEDGKIFPISGSPFSSLNKASNALVSEDMKLHPKEKLIRQRHTLYAVPVHEIAYSHHAKEGTFFIYGQENKLFLDKYLRHLNSPTSSKCSFL